MFISILILSLIQLGTIFAQESLLQDLTFATASTKLECFKSKPFETQQQALKECNIMVEERQDFPLRATYMTLPLITMGMILGLHYVKDFIKAHHEGWACSSLIDDNCPSIATVTPYWPSMWDNLRNTSFNWAIIGGGAMVIPTLCLLHESEQRHRKISLDELVKFRNQLEHYMMQSNEKAPTELELHQYIRSMKLSNFDQKWNSDFRIKLGTFAIIKYDSANKLLQTIKNKLKDDEKLKNLELKAATSLMTFYLSYQLALALWDGKSTYAAFLAWMGNLGSIWYMVLDTKHRNCVEKQLKVLEDFSLSIQNNMPRQ